MERAPLVVISLDEIASRWQIPVERIIYFITNCGMNPAEPEKWGVENWDLLIKEKQEAFEDSLFPRELRLEPSEPAS